ncbi:MAG: hypothetical protein JRJ00_02070 [Deltaproteobacteria bacterium]|nr:hypothetical protein [Deltaproteobacteria bacterium]
MNGFPHDIKGQGIYVFVNSNSGVEKSDGFKKELVKHVRSQKRWRNRKWREIFPPI